MSFFDLLGEHVLLVQEEDDGGGGEVAVVADTVEQVQALVHSILKEKFDDPLMSTKLHTDKIKMVNFFVPLRHPPPAPCRRRSEQQ